MNIKFIPSKFFFDCCKASSVPIKTKWYCQEEGFLYSPHGWLDLLISITPGVIALSVSLPWFDSQEILTFRKKYQTDFESHVSPTGVEGEGGM